MPWLSQNENSKQWVVLRGSNKNHQFISGGKVIPIWEMYRIIVKEISQTNPAGNAISEQFQYTLHWVIPKKINNNAEKKVSRRELNITADDSIRHIVKV